MSMSTINAVTFDFHSATAEDVELVEAAQKLLKDLPGSNLRPIRTSKQFAGGDEPKPSITLTYYVETGASLTAFVAAGDIAVVSITCSLYGSRDVVAAKVSFPAQRDEVTFDASALSAQEREGHSWLGRIFTSGLKIELLEAYALYS